MKTAEIVIEDGEGKVVTFKLAPTPLVHLSEHISKFEAGFEGSKSIEALIECVFHGAKRAKAAITLEWLLANVDMNNLDIVLKVFMDVNGLVPKASKSAGEAPAAVAT